MSDIKSKVQDVDPNVQARDLQALTADTTNVYRSLSVIATRARHLNDEIKSELYSKLDEFATNSETIEEVMENKEQIEISKFYERLPNPAVIATEEFLRGDLSFRSREEESEEDGDIIES